MVGSREDTIGLRLPDEVIEYIFTLTTSPKDLVRTSLLAKRWRNFWVSVPLSRLNFDDVRHGPSLDFFDRFLQRRSSSGGGTTAIERLSFNLWYGDVMCKSVNTALKTSLNTALSFRVRELHIFSQLPNSRYQTGVYQGMVPISVFSAPHLTTLETCKFRSPKGGGEFCISCPDLETFVMKDCAFGTALALRTPKLNKLEIRNTFSPRQVLELQHTPNLSSFSFVLHTSPKHVPNYLECNFGNQLVLVVDDPLSNGGQPPPRRCLLHIKKASHAWVSAIGQYQSLEKMTVVLGKLFKSYDNLRSLELYASFDCPVHVARFASVLMSSCSSIEILLLKVVERFKMKYEGDIEVPELPLFCTLSKLKYIGVQVKGLDCELELYRLFRFLLRSAVNLQKMVIEWKRYEYNIGDSDPFLDKIFQEYPEVHFSFQFS